MDGKDRNATLADGKQLPARGSDLIGLTQAEGLRQGVRFGANGALFVRRSATFEVGRAIVRSRLVRVPCMSSDRLAGGIQTATSISFPVDANCRVLDLELHL